ncbi:hypothetical protein M422DRAFT_245090 [Sphaerobolus stellatus SS14]|nr:hypothetical protein M422DRAFT_245090 [Sphaerobolus stellatus SS14]
MTTHRSGDHRTAVLSVGIIGLTASSLAPSAYREAGPISIVQSAYRLRIRYFVLRLSDCPTAPGEQTHHILRPTDMVWESSELHGWLLLDSRLSCELSATRGFTSSISYLL